MKRGEQWTEWAGGWIWEEAKERKRWVGNKWAPLPVGDGKQIIDATASGEFENKWTHSSYAYHSRTISPLRVAPSTTPLHPPPPLLLPSLSL